MRFACASLPSLSAGTPKAQHCATLHFEMVTSSSHPLVPCFAGLGTAALARQVPLFDLAFKAVEPTSFRVVKMKGDGRCLFRALASGMARNQGRFLGASAEEQEADQLRLAVAEALCRTAERRKQFPQAVMAVEAEDKLPNYCRRIVQPTFWGGEPEMIVLSQMLKVPIYVYLPTKGGKGFTLLQKYGDKWTKPSKERKKGRKPVCILFVDGNHFDLLVH